jgi:type I restriction enzyme M protein
MAKVEFKVPTWVEKRYSLLWNAFNDSEFNIEQAAKILEEKNKDKREEIPVYLSEIRKAGWLTDEPDPSDARKRIYKLKSKEKIIGEIFAINNNKLDRGEVEGLLKKAADLIRTRVDYYLLISWTDHLTKSPHLHEPLFRMSSVLCMQGQVNYPRLESGGNSL